MYACTALHLIQACKVAQAKKVVWRADVMQDRDAHHVGVGRCDKIRHAQSGALYDRLTRIPALFERLAHCQGTEL